jgi:BTB/POZ domain-containing protein KCTD9
MNTELPTRLSYEDSCRLLMRLGYLYQGDYSGKLPVLPDRRPQSGDDLPHGVRFFRTWVGSGRPFRLQTPPDFESDNKQDDLENLTLPRTFFGRSEISRISFKNTDLSESTLCWNDFIEVNFTDADLSACDLRASLYVRSVFVRAYLRDADLRRSTFKECDFTDADLRGAKLTRAQGGGLPLSENQKQTIDWLESSGEEPPGG